MSKSFLLLTIVLFLLIGCTEDEPNLVWDPNPSVADSPIITSIEPPNSAFSGAEPITIRGKNFSEDIDKNRISVKGVVGAILSASKTEITALSPSVIGDSLVIRIDVIGAYDGVEFYPYQLKSPSKEYGNFAKEEVVHDIEFDSDGNLYALITDAANVKKVVKISENGLMREDYGTVSIPIGQPSMKFGTDGSLFIPRKNNKKLYRIPSGGGATELVKSFPGKIKSLDFDEVGDMYIGGNGNKIFRYKTSGSIETVADYDTTNIIAVRVFNKFLYVVGQTKKQSEEGLIIEQAIWKNKIISSTENLGTKELVYNWSEKHPDYLISEITFSEDGNMYMASNEDNPIVVLSPLGDKQYLYAGILKAPALGITWGTAEYLYYINEQTTPEYFKKVMQVYVNKSSAPYYGRK